MKTGGVVNALPLGFHSSRVVEAARRALAGGELRIGWFAAPPRSLAQGAVVFAALAGLGFAEGGLLPRTWRLASIAFLALAAAALLARRPGPLRRLEVAVVGVFAALVVWTAASAAWSTRPTASLLQGERVLVFAAAVLAFVLLAERAAAAHALAGALAATTVLAAYGLVRYVVAPPPLDVYEGRLLYEPLGYANALGIVVAIGIVLSVGLARIARGRARAAALAPVAVLAPALYLTSSRGAVVALVAGLVVLLAVGRSRTTVLALAGAIAIGAAALALSHVPLSRLAGENRPHYWRVAVEDAGDHPALGSGAGTYGDYWLRHRPVRTFTRTAHSLYLQSLAELGPVGLVLVVTALGLPLLALRRRRDPLAAAAAGAYVAYLVHTGIDWDWELPGATLAGLVCGAALAVAARGADAGSQSTRARTPLLVAVVALAAVEVVRLATGPGTPFGV